MDDANTIDISSSRSTQALRDVLATIEDHHEGPETPEYAVSHIDEFVPRLTSEVIADAFAILGIVLFTGVFLYVA